MGSLVLPGDGGEILAEFLGDVHSGLVVADEAENLVHHLLGLLGSSDSDDIPNVDVNTELDVGRLAGLGLLGLGCVAHDFLSFARSLVSETTETEERVPTLVHLLNPGGIAFDSTVEHIFDAAVLLLDDALVGLRHEVEFDSGDEVMFLLKAVLEGLSDLLARGSASHKFVVIDSWHDFLSFARSLVLGS